MISIKPKVIETKADVVSKILELIIKFSVKINTSLAIKEFMET
jgi:hypothetical protein